MLPVQILLSNLLSDLPLISIATDRVDKDELSRPKAYHLRSVLPLVIALAVIITTIDFIFFGLFFKETPKMIQTLWFIESTICELLLVFVIRTKGLFWKAEGLSKALLISIISVFAITIILPFTQFGKTVLHFTSPCWQQLSILSALFVGFVITSEIVKLIYFNRFKPRESVLN